MGTYNEDFDELLAFARQSDDLAREVRHVFDTTQIMAVIDDDATKAANNGCSVMKLPEPYARLLAAARAGQFGPLVAYREGEK